MNNRSSLPIGTLFVVLVVALAAIGVGYGLWSQSLFIRGTVQTGNVSAEFRGAFSDDDGQVDDASLDAGDTGDCPISSASGPSSCDPAASEDGIPDDSPGGPGPEPRFDKDVGRCVAEVLPNRTLARVTKTSVYPGYFCTSWFAVHNDGTVPVKIASAEVNGRPVTPSVPTPFDLNGDGGPDVAIHLTGIDVCQQIEPSQTVLMDVDQEILDDVPEGSTLGYTVEVKLIQWNEECLEVDEFPNSRALIGIQLPDGSLTTVRLSGPTTVHVNLAALADASPTESGEPDGLEQVPTEIVALELTGNSPLGPVVLRLRDPAKHPFMRSLGEIEENFNASPGRLDIPPFAASGACPGGCTADSFFDVFFEVEVAGAVLHNDTSIRMQARITHKPPDQGNRYQKPAGAIPLFDEDDNPTGISLVSASHVPNPGPLPDLTVPVIRPTSVECFVVGNVVQCTATVDFDILNDSGVDVTEAFDVLIEADQVPSTTVTVEGLAAGATETFAVTLGPGGNCFDPDCTVQVTVDVNDDVEESDETNNSAARTDIG